MSRGKGPAWTQFPEYTEEGHRRAVNFEVTCICYVDPGITDGASPVLVVKATDRDGFPAFTSAGAHMDALSNLGGP